MLTSIIYGCSSEDSTDEILKNESFFEVTFLGETYKKDFFAGGVIRVDDCNGNGEDDLEYEAILQIETSKFYLEADYVSPRLLSYWDKDETPESRLIADNSSLWDTDCYESFDFILSLNYLDNSLIIDESANNWNQINKLTFRGENSEYKEYLAHGNFEVTYILEDGSTATALGKYSYPIDFMK